MLHIRRKSTVLARHQRLDGLLDGLAVCIHDREALDDLQAYRDSVLDVHEVGLSPA